MFHSLDCSTWDWEEYRIINWHGYTIVPLTSLLHLGFGEKIRILTGRLSLWSHWGCGVMPGRERIKWHARTFHWVLFLGKSRY